MHYADLDARGGVAEELPITVLYTSYQGQAVAHTSQLNAIRIVAPQMVVPWVEKRLD